MAPRDGPPSSPLMDGRSPDTVFGLQSSHPKPQNQKRSPLHKTRLELPSSVRLQHCFKQRTALLHATNIPASLLKPQKTSPKRAVLSPLPAISKRPKQFGSLCALADWIFCTAVLSGGCAVFKGGNLCRSGRPTGRESGRCSKRRLTGRGE